MLMGPPEQIMARLDVEVDTPVRSVKVISSVVLRAVLGVVKLRTSGSGRVSNGHHLEGSSSGI